MNFTKNRTISTVLTTFSVAILLFSCTEISTPPPVSFGYGEEVSTVTSQILNEISGLARSKHYKDCYWVHNDSGDDPNIYLINLDGELITTVTIDATNRDWEDITIDNNYIYIGEVGDNYSVYPNKIIYRIKEPQNIDTTLLGTKISITDVDSMVFNFADMQRDCETLMADPITGELIMTSKREDSILVYQTPFIPSTDGSLKIEPKLTIGISMAVAGDISENGARILIKNYNNIYYWYRNPETETVLDALSKEPTPLPYKPEPQGEAIVWDAKGDTFYTVSEQRDGVIPVIYVYQQAK